MPKVKQCTIPGFEGEVTFCDPLTIEQVFAIEEAQDNAAEEIETSKFWEKMNELRGVKDEAGNIVKVSWSSKSDALFVPAIIKCVKEWKIERVPQNVTADTFPFTPRKHAGKFVDWLWNELLIIYQGETDIPNESSPTPTATQ